MGKKSLTKSTTPKKAASKAKDKMKTAAAKKKAVPKKKAVAPKKKKAPAKKKAAPKKKTAPAKKKTALAKKKAVPAKKKTVAAKKAPAPATKAKVAAPKPKKRTAKEILFQKFDTVLPSKPFKITRKTSTDFTAPPFIAADRKAEEKRLRDLLFAKFDKEAIRAAGKQAAAAEAAAKEAATQKAIAEKAAAIKAAEEKIAAAEKVLAAPPQAEKDPMQKVFIGAAAVFALIILLLLGSSIKNSARYYLVPSEGELQVWQGTFAPQGEELLIALPGVTTPEEVREVYTRTEVFPLAFAYYIDKADALLEVSGTPDYEGIKAYINMALPYACTPDLREAAYARLDGIEFNDYLFKANVAARKNTIDGHEAAINLLNKAALLDVGDDQMNIITARIAASEAAVVQLKTAAEQARLEAEAAAAAEEAAKTETEESANAETTEAAAEPEDGKAEAEESAEAPVEESAEKEH